MLCNNCKKEITEDSIFCTYCGNQIKKTDNDINHKPSSADTVGFRTDAGYQAVSPGFKSQKKIPASTIISSGIAVILALVLGIILLSHGWSASAFSSNTEKFFDTPEAAARYFTDCISKNDFEGALKAFAVNKEVENYSSAAEVKHLQAFIPGNMLAPEYPSYSVLNHSYLFNRASQSIKAFVYSLLWDADLTQVIYDTDYNASNVYELLDPSNVKIKLERIDYVSPDLQDSDRNQENWEEWGKIYGYSDIKEYYALYDNAGKYYFGGFQFVKYEKGWQINLLCTYLGGTPVQGNLTPITKDEYLGMVE